MHAFHLIKSDYSVQNIHESLLVPIAEIKYKEIENDKLSNMTEISFESKVFDFLGVWRHPMAVKPNSK